MKKMTFKDCYYNETKTISENRRVFIDVPHNKVEQRQESAEKLGTEAEQQEAKNKEIVRRAEWMIDHLNNRNFGSNANKTEANTHSGYLKRDLALLKEEGKKGDTTERIYSRLNKNLNDSKAFIERINRQEAEKEEKKEIEKLQKTIFARCGQKLQDASRHFNALPEKHRTFESAKKVISDFMNDWWTHEDEGQKTLAIKYWNIREQPNRVLTDLNVYMEDLNLKREVERVYSPTITPAGTNNISVSIDRVSPY